MGSNEPVNTAQMYRLLGLRLRNLTINPGQEWPAIHREETTFNEMMSSFALPLIGLVALGTFISQLINQQAFLLELALKKVGVEFAALFLGLIVAWYFVLWIMKYFHFEPSRETAAKLTIYSSSSLYLVLLITALVPEVFFLQIFGFYAIYLMWIGVRLLKGPSQVQKNWFSLVAGLAILGFPYLIRIVLLNLITI
ncbi:YIP1 family protein [Thermophagus sp. OGC60D27]|uniref:YIP1 family protein n=1 Tax=Thermophagus sp. OGC60D27 TaxID=3458415 RepID=UPI00403848DF